MTEEVLFITYVVHKIERVLHTLLKVDVAFKFNESTFSNGWGLNLDNQPLKYINYRRNQHSFLSLLIERHYSLHTYFFCYNCSFVWFFFRNLLSITTVYLWHRESGSKVRLAEKWNLISLHTQNWKMRYSWHHQRVFWEVYPTRRVEQFSASHSPSTV